MKELSVKKLAIENPSFEELASIFQNIPTNNVDTVNWEGFPTSAKASFKIAHNGENLYLQFNVSENEILALIDADNGKVSKDSCVEFFVSFDDNKHYYNIELSCIGKLLMGYRDLRPNAIYASDAVLSSIKREASLGSKNFDKKQGEFDWTLTLMIPASAFWGSDIKSFDGLEAKANFYKCGDLLTQKHYLSWSPIGTEKPSFHETSYFGRLCFE